MSPSVLPTSQRPCCLQSSADPSPSNLRLPDHQVLRPWLPAGGQCGSYWPRAGSGRTPLVPGLLLAPPPASRSCLACEVQLRPHQPSSLGPAVGRPWRGAGVLTRPGPHPQSRTSPHGFCPQDTCSFEKGNSQHGKTLTEPVIRIQTSMQSEHLCRSSENGRCRDSKGSQSRRVTSATTPNVHPAKPSWM